MIVVRLAKVVMTGSLAAFTCLVTVDNVTDYAANYAFVQHVLSMDTTFSDSLRDRAITDPALWRIAYLAIIAAEGLTGIAFGIGTVALLRRLRGRAAEFARAKRFVVAGAAFAFLLWFTGFMVVGGEWFAMWQSKVWNGQEAAFRFYMTALAVLIFVNQPDAELAARQ
jgi:predicted small integral membrane protein